MVHCSPTYCEGKGGHSRSKEVIVGLEHARRVEPCPTRPRVGMHEFDLMVMETIELVNCDNLVNLVQRLGFCSSRDHLSTGGVG